MVLGDLKLQRRVRTMFDDMDQELSDFGRVTADAQLSIAFGPAKS